MYLYIDTDQLKHCNMVRNVLFLHFLIFLFGISIISAANIFDLLWNDDDSLVEKRDESTDSESQQTCACGKTCMCCVDFNITYIDLGGPGCVQMRYISQDEGIAVNVSYGESLLHSEQVKGPNPAPTCMTLFGNLAQVCARFSSLEPHNDGLRGCLLLEPKLLGDLQTQFDIGCFIMGPNGMKIDPASNSTLTQLLASDAVTVNTTESDSEAETFNEEELIAAVNESAEQGLAFFENLFGLSFGKPSENSTDTTETTSAPEAQTSSADTSRKIRKLSSKHNEI